jgi:hypothetical protein
MTARWQFFLIVRALFLQAKELTSITTIKCSKVWWNMSSENFQNYGKLGLADLPRVVKLIPLAL